MSPRRSDQTTRHLITGDAFIHQNHEPRWHAYWQQLARLLGADQPKPSQPFPGNWDCFCDDAASLSGRHVSLLLRLQERRERTQMPVIPLEHRNATDASHRGLSTELLLLPAKLFQAPVIFGAPGQPRFCHCEKLQFNKDSKSERSRTRRVITSRRGSR